MEWVELLMNMNEWVSKKEVKLPFGKRKARCIFHWPKLLPVKGPKTKS